MGSSDRRSKGSEKSEPAFDESDLAVPPNPILESSLRYLILACIYIVAFTARLFAIVRYESVIHEFDPYFNYRTTQQFVEKGFYDFLNWFDEASWYPLGRIVGGTVYPGLIVTAGTIKFILDALHISVEVRNVCVFLGPVFAGFCASAAYLFTQEAYNRKAGLMAAAFMCVVPSYISRSVGGSYDYECIAIFAMMYVFYRFLVAVRTGSMFWAAASSLAYFYMVSSWGGYSFCVNLIPLFALARCVTGKATSRLYVAYNVWYILGTLLSMQIPVVGFLAVQTGEHVLAIVAFVAMQVVFGARKLRQLIGGQLAVKALYALGAILAAAVALAVTAAIATGFIRPFTGRSMTLLDPTYASKYIPIIASVAEHQATTWSSYFFDLHLCIPFAPLGLAALLRKGGESAIFAVLYGMTTVYFSGVMIRMMLVLAPIACVLGGIGVSVVVDVCATMSSKKVSSPLAKALYLMPIVCVATMLGSFVRHGVWAASEAYSSPSIVLAGRGNNGQPIIFDDFREAYFWLRQNTPENAKIMSWWDYGYQMTAMANRTVLVDNNTWNNTHIATVGMAMSSDEKTGYTVMEKLDADYVLVIFGGYLGYSGDDVNKFLWMVRIGGGVYPQIKEPDYFKNGQYRVDKEGSPVLHNSLMYRLSYYRFGEVTLDARRPPGFDRVRNTEIAVKDIKLEYVEEAFTSEHWLVRIYKVKKQPNRGVLGRHPRRRKSLIPKSKKKRAQQGSRRRMPMPAATA